MRGFGEQMPLRHREAGDEACEIIVQLRLDGRHKLRLSGQRLVPRIHLSQPGFYAVSIKAEEMFVQG